MADSQNKEQEVWVTGIGIISSLGEGLEAHWQALTADNPQPVVDEKIFAPYPIHPLCEIDFSKQIPKRGDLRQMEDWQRIGTYAAGMALDDAGIKGNEELLAKTHIIAAAGNGERDPQADATVLAAIKDDPNWREKLNDLLLTNLRPTLYLAQQTQLLAGNISIVHKVTGGSRTFKGEEIAGVQIVENAVQRIRAGQGELFLVGAANNAARPDLHLVRELNGLADMPLGSMGAFLVIENADHAKSRGAKPYAKISYAIATDEKNSGFDIGSRSELEHNTHWTSGHEYAPSVFLSDLLNPENSKDHLSVINLADLFGHGIEAQFPFGVVLASLASSKDGQQVLVTCNGRNIGKGTAQVGKVDE